MVIEVIEVTEVTEVTEAGYRWRAELLALIIRGGFALTLGAYAFHLKAPKQHVTDR